MSKVIEVTSNNFDSEVRNYNGKVLVDFNANWCGPCRMLRPILDEVSSEKEGVKFVSINIDNEESLSSEFGIYSIPCLILFENGTEKKRSVGLLQKEDLERFIG